MRLNYETQAIHLKSTPNARELGGIVIKNPQGDKKIKRGLLLRTGGLDKLTEEDKTKLTQNFGVSTIADFRSSMELEKAPDQVIEGSINFWLPVIPETAEASDIMGNMTPPSEGPISQIIAAAEVDLSDFYWKIIQSEQAQQSYKQFFQLLLGAEGAVLWHCTGGKDRTGIASAMLLCLLGADEETIMQDYLLSNTFYQPQIDKLQKQVLEETGRTDLLPITTAIVGVSPEAMQTVLEKSAQESGSFADWITQHLSLSEDDLNALKQRFLTDTQ